MIHFFDMFSGIGGFRPGLERVCDFVRIDHCEIDKHADKAAHEAVVGTARVKMEAVVV